ncbi:MAG: M15 family metallopeptidase, partial [Actinomycetota bacterium]
PVTLRVGAVDPLQYRSIAPAPTREADFVWNSLLAGEAVVTFEGAEKLGLSDGGDITLGRRRNIHVGAFADNGTPNMADVLVDLSIGQQLNLGGNEVLTIGARSGTPVDLLGRQLERRAPDARLLPLIPSGIASHPNPRTAPLEGTAGGGLIGRMNFKVLDDGFIEPDSAWVEHNIAVGEVPLLGEVTCHRLLIPQLAAALNEIAERGLADAIDPGQYGGCYVPRFVDRNPDLPLSMHAFGLALDINVATNQLGTAGDMDPRVVEIFEKWGFVWGGRWSRPDPMHFELAHLLDL